MLKTTLLFENYGVSELDYIGYGVKFKVPGHAIGGSGVTVSVPAESATDIATAVAAKRPAIVITIGSTTDDGEAPDYIPVDKTPVNAVASTGTLTVTAGGSNISDGNKVTIGTKEYTFKTELTPTEGQVLIGANDTAALLNLKDAINRDTPLSKDGVKYKCAAAHPTVEGVSSDATTCVVRAKTKGEAGDAIATTETGTNLSWGETHLDNGVNGTPGMKNEVCVDASYIYHCIAANTIADANWRRVALGSAY